MIKGAKATQWRKVEKKTGFSANSAGTIGTIPKKEKKKELCATSGAID